MNYGFITGLPRSGSAWLANYLSYGNSCFIHDAWKNDTPERLKEKFDSYNVYSAGTSDPANMILLDEIDKVFPDAKWVVVTRPVQEVEKACKDINFPIMDFTKHLEKLTSSRKVYKVKFKDIFNKADEIGKYIYPEFESPKWRKDALKDLNIQLHWGRVSEQFKVPEQSLTAESITSTKLEYYRLIREIVNEDISAIRFLQQAREISELYRSLNENKAISLNKSKESIEAVVTEWMVNPFVVRFSASLAPAIVSALEKYLSNETKHCPIDTDLVAVVTYIFRGNEGVKEFMPKIRELSDKILSERL